MNDINHDKTNSENKKTIENQEAITEKTESDISESLSETPLTPDQKIDKLLEGMNNMNNGVNQTMELFKQMMKFLIENSATTNKMMMEQKGMMIEQKEMIKQFMESQIKQGKDNEEQAKKVNEFIAEEAKKREEKRILDELLTYWNTTDDIKKLLKEIYVSGYINETDEYGSTLLHLAISRGHIEMIKTLLKHPQINLEIKNGYGYTPLILAERIGYTEIAKIIKNHINNKK